MAATKVDRGFAVVLGVSVTGIKYEIAGTWSGNTWNGRLNGDVTWAPDADTIEHRNPATGAVDGMTYYNQRQTLQITFIPGSTASQAAATAASIIEIVKGSVIELTSADTLVGAGTPAAGDRWIIDSASRVSSATGMTTYNLGLVRYGDGLNSAGAEMGNVIS